MLGEKSAFQEHQLSAVGCWLDSALWDQYSERALVYYAMLVNSWVSSISSALKVIAYGEGGLLCSCYYLHSIRQSVQVIPNPARAFKCDKGGRLGFSNIFSFPHISGIRVASVGHIILPKVFLLTGCWRHWWLHVLSVRNFSGRATQRSLKELQKHEPDGLPGQLLMSWV